MQARSTPTPDPGISGEFGARALYAALFFGFVFPIFQHVAWLMLIDLPASSEVLSQPPHAWLYLGLFGILPPLAFVLAVSQATTEAGIAGGMIYVLMWLVAQQFFGNPVLTILILIGLVMGAFVFFALKAFSASSDRRGRYPPR